MNRFLATAILVFCAFNLDAQRLTVHKNGRYLVTEDGEPFFWLADTAWELFHRCDKEEATSYLEKRASQGFNVVQAVALAEIDGLNTPNPYGDKPLLNNDPTKPNDAYFEHVDYVINKANELGIYIALLPTWGDKVNTESWGVGPVVFNPENARVFGEWMGNRYKDYDNIVWVIGGDRNPREDSDDIAIWNNMAEGIAAAAGGYENTLMTFHPQPTEEGEGGSSTWFHNEEWLDFNMHQTGHCANKGTYQHIEHDYALSPNKPVLDGEPLYENHPHCFNANERGYSTHDDIRRIMYWNVFAGAFGQTYGCHAVWQMWQPDREPINQPLGPWHASLDLPMANQVQHLKNLVLSRPVLTRVPDQSMVVGPQPDYTEYVSATRDEQGRYAMIYLPKGGSKRLDLTALSGEELSTWWYDPRTGNNFPGKKLEKSNRVEVEAPTTANDWVLVIDSEEYSAPGSTSSD
ncbi:MAG: glycoside hydrolase family 140 protein [Tunicatimonas sp.]|uniref:glycoside hydrolase family 140 protein n=1 Tax=Tunicatimonas sp. TaxID=1940096 RepID=UPI003C75672F